MVDIFEQFLVEVVSAVDSGEISAEVFDGHRLLLLLCHRVVLVHVQHDHSVRQSERRVCIHERLVVQSMPVICREKGEASRSGSEILSQLSCKNYQRNVR